ncbi:MAG: hypothetical protein JRF28_07800 [Deltaproteobacteria bacterium]|nr:hypothetical protein [Deltaproteobacteria bacterium]
MRNLRYYAPGITLILIAILIVAVPEILVAFVVGLIVMAGIGALYIGHMIRRSSIESDGGGADDRFNGWRYARRPVFRRGFWKF